MALKQRRGRRQVCNVMSNLDVVFAEVGDQRRCPLQFKHMLLPVVERNGRDFVAFAQEMKQQGGRIHATTEGHNCDVVGWICHRIPIHLCV